MTTFDLPSRRERMARALELTDELVLIGAGEPIGLPGGADQTYPYLSNYEYFYLSDREVPGGVLAFDPKEGPRDGWTDFVPVVTQLQRVWEGMEQTPGTPLAELAPWLAARRGRPIVMLGSALAGIVSDSGKTLGARERFTHARRAKEPCEIARMKEAVRATAGAYAAVMPLVREGITERRFAVELEAEFFRHGCTRTCYGSIVAAGSNAAVLHFEPSSRVFREGDLLLIDAGGELNRYGCDVTRTYAVGGKASAERRELHAVVHRAFERAIPKCVVGAEWLDVHLGAALDMTEGLVQMGVLKGSPQSLFESNASALFFPHGLGHMIGLGVRDASGRMPGREPSTRPGLSKLRMDLPLQSGYCVTVEPGLYFVSALLNDPTHRAQHKDSVNWSLVDMLLASGIGGVRIEDNIHVTASGPENLTGMIRTQL